jgi:hypothetical protein
MIGVDAALERDLKQRYSEAEIAQFFSGRANRGQILLIYQRPNGDRTSGLPSSRHMHYCARNWVAVALADPPPAWTKAVSPAASTTRKK